MSSLGQDFEAAEVRAQLERILASRAFARANRSCQLLFYLVDCALEGRLEQLMEYPIAVDVFVVVPVRGPRPDEGYIGLQNHDGRSVVYFKEISVR